MFECIREKLLSEAKLSPQLLSDLAGLESYVAESYDSRSFIELLQNADDAKSTSFLVKRIEQFLIVANNGNPFSLEDVEAICRSAASNKSRGSSIGYRGIGFKSVVGIANEVHIISEGLKLTFSRELTAHEIPAADKVPLIRIPHQIKKEVLNDIEKEVLSLKNEGYITFFVFSDLTVNSIEHEFDNFDPLSMLFLRNINKLQLQGSQEECFYIRKKRTDQRIVLARLEGIKHKSNWIIISKNDGSLAFNQSMEEKKVQPLPASDAVAHAFLPTNEPSGLGIKINGDFSTDPSRTRIVFDERTISQISSIAKLIVELMIITLTDESFSDKEGIFQALLPLEDPHLHRYQRKSFKSELILEIKKECEYFMRELKVKPSWLNAIDFEEINKSKQNISAPRFVSNIEGAAAYLRYLGAKELSTEQVLLNIKEADLTKNGCAEITAQLIKLFDTKQIDPTLISSDLRILCTSQGRASFQDAIELKVDLDRDYLDLVSERCGGLGGLERLVKSLFGEKLVSNVLPVKTEKEKEKEKESIRSQGGFIDAINTSSIGGGNVAKTYNVKKWRGAEEQLRDLLEAEGLSAQDVSRQNIGYDIECQDDKGDKYFIEVKLIQSDSQSFSLTSNEESVARQKGENYIVALFRQLGDRVEVAYIRNPLKNLTFERQCQKWVWVCADYDYKPTIYELQDDSQN